MGKCTITGSVTIDVADNKTVETNGIEIGGSSTVTVSTVAGTNNMFQAK